MNDDIKNTQSDSEKVENIAVSDPEQRSSDEKDRKKRLRKSMIKFGSLAVFAFIVFIFATISWFSSNRNVSAGNMTIKTSTLPFDIATKGASVRKESVINSVHSEYLEGTSDTYSDASETEETYYVGDSLLLRYTPDTDDPATEDIDESETLDISPGSSGELSLYVIPKVNNAINVKITLDVIAFAEIDKFETETSVNEETGETEDITQKNGTQIIEITNTSDFAAAARDVNNEAAAGAAEEYIAAANYLKGHILFFGGEGDTTNAAESARYYYTKPYTTRIFSQPVAAGNKGKAVQVPVYWMWTNTLGQIALQTNANDLRSGIPVVQETTVNTNDDTLTDKELLLDYLNSNKENIFLGTESITENMIYSADAIANFDTLSKQYNAADYEIGTKIAYFMIEVNIEPGP